MTLLANAPSMDTSYVEMGEMRTVNQPIYETSWKVPFSVTVPHYGMFRVLLGRSSIARDPDSAWRLDDAVLTVRHSTMTINPKDAVVFANIGGVPLPATRLSDCSINTPSLGETVDLTVLVNAMTSSADRTSTNHRRRAVPTELLSEWGSALLATAGLHANKCSVVSDDPVFIEYGDGASHGRRAIRVAPAHLEATCSVVDQPLLARAFLLGIGSRRSYGFGQLVITQSTKGAQA